MEPKGVAIRMYEIPEARAIMAGEMEGLSELCSNHGIVPEQDGCYSVCEMCTALRRVGTVAMASS